MGRDFCFVGYEVTLQVGNQDFALDLLSFHPCSRTLLPSLRTSERKEHMELLSVLQRHKPQQPLHQHVDNAERPTGNRSERIHSGSGVSSRFGLKWNQGNAQHTAADALPCLAAHVYLAQHSRPKHRG
jgi:hypothetical protein